MSNYRKLLLALFVTASLTACSTPEPQSKLNVEKSAIMSSYATVEAVDMKTRIGRAEPGEKPAAVDVTETSVSATIEAIDKVNETATLKMPDGSYRIVKAEDPTNLDKVKVGDTIVIVYQEAVGIFVKGMNK